MDEVNEASEQTTYVLGMDTRDIDELTRQHIYGGGVTDLALARLVLVVC